MSIKSKIGVAATACALLVGVPVTYASLQSDAADHYFDIQGAAQLVSSGQYAQAAALYATLTAEDPDNGALWLAEAKAYQNAGDTQNAINAYKKVHELGFDGPYNSLAVSKLYASLGNKDAALDWFEIALGQRLDGRTGYATDPAYAAFASDPRFKQLTGQPAIPITNRVQGWRYDIDLLVKEAQRLDANPDRPQFSEAWLNQASELRKAVPEMTDEQLSLAVRRLVVDLNDGHTSALPNPLFQMVQADLWKFEDGVFIIGGPGVQQDAVGGKVLEIGGKSIGTLLEQAKEYQPHDNAKMYDWTFRVYLMDPAVLKALGAMAANADHATFTIRDRDGVVRTVDVGLGGYREPKLYPSSIASEPVPLYQTDENRNFWLRSLPDINAVWFQFNQVFFDFGTGKSLATMSNELWASLQSTNAKYLIVDTRLNNGGNSLSLPPLLKVLSAFERADPSHKIFVITGRGTFSAAQIFINEVERFTNATFVGEEASAGPNFTGEDGSRFTLPWSKMRINVSFRYHQSSLTDDRRPWIPVSIPAPLTSEQYFHNQDPAQDAITEVIHRLP